MAAVLRNRVPAHARHYGSRRRVRRSREAHKRIPGFCEFEIMSVAAISEARVASRPPKSFRSFFRQTEDLGGTLVLSAMVLLPLLEAGSRRTLHTGMPASIPMVPHAVLPVGLIGCSISVRAGRVAAR